MRVRRATAADLPALSRVLEAALVRDPFVNWMADGRVDRRAQYVELILRKVALPLGEVYTTDDLASTSLWIPPGGWRTGLMHQLWLLPGLIRAVGLRRLNRVSERLAEVERWRPPEPWFLLALLGTHPTRIGEGRASATLTPILDRCDRQNVNAIVDTSLERNQRFYERFGFRTVSRVELALGGPHCWTMLRRPRGWDSTV